MERVSPNIFVTDIHATVAFYTTLGFTINDSVVLPTGETVFVLMTWGTVIFMFQTFASIEGKLPAVSRIDGGSLLLYINIKGIRTFYDRIKDQVTIINGLEKTFYGATEFSICDNNNYILTFAEDE